ncbi:MAG: helix-turn-helix domain-containing protein [Anaerolineales bacterium]|nr:helix-turn-helix domain-containing protein [Anaerolineales bacterium]
MSDLQTMSQQELTRLEAMQRIEKERLRQGEAAAVLGVSKRHVRRLLRAHRRSGVEGLISKQRGKPRNNQLKEGV